MEYEIKVVTSAKLNDTDLDDLMVAALEGGITYWCGEVKVKEGSMSEEDYEKTQYSSDVISKGGTLILFDAESDDTWELDRDKFLKGIQMYCEQYNVVPKDLMDFHDADVADSIVQLAVFGEITFS